MSASGSLEFSSTTNIMQQCGTTNFCHSMSSSQMATDDDGDRCNSPVTSRGRVLVRSHAMREETSPPRIPTPTLCRSLSSSSLPSCIKYTPPSKLPLCCQQQQRQQISSKGNSHPLVVLSPSGSPSPCHSPNCISPTSTLVPSPNDPCSPHCTSSSPVLMHEVATMAYENDIIEDVQQQITPVNQTGGPSSQGAASSQYLNSPVNAIVQKNKCVGCDCNATVQKEKIVNMNGNNNLTVNHAIGKGKLRQQSSSQSSFEGGATNSPCLSRESSYEQYTDTTGVDLEVFIPETLNRNATDRAFMLRIEQELVSLAKDKIKTHYKFPPMSSYQRMLVHRCAAYFGMDHNIESSGKCVVVNKTKCTRIPEVEFKVHIKDDIVFTDELKRSILKRDCNSTEEYNCKLTDGQYSTDSRRSKSFEEREEEYEKARNRIFNHRERVTLFRQIHNGCTSDDFDWSEVPWSSSESDNMPRYKLQMSENRRVAGKLTKVQSEECNEPSCRPCVSKSYSFSGYDDTGFGHGNCAEHPEDCRSISKQDSSTSTSSISWRLSPSSSGYKSQSQMSESITPSPTSTPNPTTNSSDPSMTKSRSLDKVDTQIMWAVTDLDSVPKGSIIINPQTGEALKNDDGSLYHYDPNNLPNGLVLTASKPPLSPKEGNSTTPILHTSAPSQNATNNGGGSANDTVRKKRFNKGPPSPMQQKSRFTNTTATSPNLTYAHQNHAILTPTGPLLQQQPKTNLQFLNSVGDNSAQMAAAHSLPIYTSGLPQTTQLQDPSAIYQQPCIVYANPYGVPPVPSYDTRLEGVPATAAQLTEFGGTYYVNLPEAAVPNVQPIGLTTAPYWNNSTALHYYQSTAIANHQQQQQQQQQQSQPQPVTSPVQRIQFPFNPHQQPPNDGLLPQVSSNASLQPPQSHIITTSSLTPPYSQTFLNPQQVAADMLPMYQQQMFYTAPNGSTPQFVYSNPPIYGQNTPIISNPGGLYAAANYPHYNAVSNATLLANHQLAQSVNEMSTTNPANMLQLTQNMLTMSLNATPPNCAAKIVDGGRQKSPKIPPHQKYGGSKNNYFVGSSQSSSTGTNSPATTIVVASNFPSPLNANNSTTSNGNNMNTGKTPPETPVQSVHGGTNFPTVLPGAIKQINPKCSGNQNSGSPTPAHDARFDKSKMPVSLTHGVPYPIPNDGKGGIIQTSNEFGNNYRPTFIRPPQRMNNQCHQSSMSHTFEFRPQRLRKPKGFRVTNNYATHSHQMSHCNETRGDKKTP